MTIAFACRGVLTEGRYKTFIATSYTFGGSVRVVLLKHGSGNWAAYANSDVSMSVEMTLKIVSDRWSIEEHFHDIKEIWGTGQQQIRNLYSSIGCWHLCGWLYAMVELECWDEPAANNHCVPKGCDSTNGISCCSQTSLMATSSIGAPSAFSAKAAMLQSLLFQRLAAC